MIVRAMALLSTGLLMVACANLADPGEAVQPQLDANDMQRIQVTRLMDGPIIHSKLHPSLGPNIQGPSLIRVPEWVKNPLGRYYLYFADHKGSYIRLATADALTGPWNVYEPGALQLEDSYFLTEPPEISAEQKQAVRRQFARLGIEVPHDPALEVTAPHIASPDVHVDAAGQRFIMYFHGLEGVGHQVTRVAVSEDGLNFAAREEVLGRTYWRGFRYQGWYYGLTMPGTVYRSRDPMSGFVEGPTLFNPDMRHSAVLLRGHWLYVFWTQVGDVPEHIKVSRIDLSGDWLQWQVEHGPEILRPERTWEGAAAALTPSKRSTAYGIVNQLRDPAVYEEGGRTYLLYAVGGEAGIAIAEITGL